MMPRSLWSPPWVFEKKKNMENSGWVVILRDFLGMFCELKLEKMGDLKQKLAKRIRNQLISTLFCEET